DPVAFRHGLPPRLQSSRSHFCPLYPVSHSHTAESAIYPLSLHDALPIFETIVFSSVSLAVSTISVPSYACQEALLTILNKTCCMRSGSMNAVISFSH